MDPRFFLPCFHGTRALRLGHKRKEKTRSITCSTDRANEANKRYLFYLCKVTVQFETEGSGQNEIASHMDRSEVKL